MGGKLGRKSVPELPDDLGQVARKYRGYNFPFENLLLEGGGAKGTAYIGAMKVLEEAGIMKSIKRFAGTSAGAITAGLMSIGMTSEEIVKEITKVNMSTILEDSPWWAPGLLTKLLYCLKCRLGFYQGYKFYSWYGQVILRHLQKHHSDTGLDENINLNQLHNVFGKELCTITYDLTYGIEMYCHAKTTPLCSIRQAVRQSMSLPVVYEPFKFEDEPDLYIDGGVCANFPIHCFDGWWLSMDEQDSFQRRLQDEEATNYFYQQSNDKRFQSANVGEEQRKQQLHKTLGLMLHSGRDRKAYRHVFIKRLEAWKDANGVDSLRARPNTKLARKYQLEEESTDKEKRAVIKEMQTKYDDKKRGLHAVLNAPRNREDMLQCFKDNFTKDDLRDFVEEADSHEVVFDVLFTKYKGGPLTDETIKNVYDNWEPFRKKLIETVPQRIIKTPKQLMDCYLDLVGQSQPIKEKDVDRCIGIDVDYVGTVDFDLEPEDQTYLMRQGAMATLAFLEDYVKKHQLQHELQQSCPDPACDMWRTPV